MVNLQIIGKRKKCFVLLVRSMAIFSIVVVLCVLSIYSGFLVANVRQQVQERNGVTCETLKVRMRDGIMLTTDVYFPKESGRHPVILLRTPYGMRLGQGCFAKGLGEGMAFWAEHGYVAVAQDARGTFRSEGVFNPIFQEQNDGYDAVEWAGTQEWSNGKVAMTGSSYMGVTQWQAAIMAPPHLVAIAPGQTATDYHDHWTYVNGVFDLWFGQSWPLTFFAPDMYRRGLIASGSSLESAREAAETYLFSGKTNISREWIHEVPPVAFDGFRVLAPYYYEWLKHPTYDDYWAQVDVETKWDQITVPALVTGAWGDLFHIGTIRAFHGLREHGGSVSAREGARLVMTGGGGHGRQGVMGFGETGNFDLRSLALRFYDHHLKGSHNDFDEVQRVQTFVQFPPDEGVTGSGFWLSGDHYPPSDIEKVRFHLRSGGSANTRWGDGVLSETMKSAGPDDRYIYDPTDPVPALGGGSCCLTLGFYFRTGTQDQSTLELRNDILVYTSKKFEEDLVMLGSVSANFWASSTGRDTDFTVKVVDVHPDGFSRNILDRVVRARFRLGSKLEPSLIEPGKPYEYRLDLGYASTVLPAGHRLRVDISSSKFPHFVRNTNTGGDFASESKFNLVTQTIHHNEDLPSFVELSVARNIKVAAE